MKLLSIPALLCLAAATAVPQAAGASPFRATGRAPFLVRGGEGHRLRDAAGKSGLADSVSVSVSVSADSVSSVSAAIPRGGACSDSTPALFLKLEIQAAAEAAGLLGILLAGLKYENALPAKVLGEPLVTLLASMLVVFGSSIVGAVLDGGLSAASMQALKPTEVTGEAGWYSGLDKPWWNPPGWAFPIMWLVVSKPTQLCATSRIFKHGLSRDAETGAVEALPLVPLAVYASMLALGDTWNKVFFGLECIGSGTVVITLFFAALLASAYLFYGIDVWAGWYMVPTCGWVAVATALQYSIYFRNREGGAAASAKKNNKRNKIARKKK